MGVQEDCSNRAHQECGRTVWCINILAPAQFLFQEIDVLVFFIYKNNVHCWRIVWEKYIKSFAYVCSTFIITLELSGSVTSPKIYNDVGIFIHSSSFIFCSTKPFRSSYILKEMKWRKWDSQWYFRHVIQCLWFSMLKTRQSLYIYLKNVRTHVRKTFIKPTHAADMTWASLSQQLAQIFFQRKKILAQPVKSRLITYNHNTNIAP